MNVRYRLLYVHANTDGASVDVWSTEDTECAIAFETENERAVAFLTTAQEDDLLCRLLDRRAKRTQRRA